VGPYTRRTIIGMRIKEALSSDSRLIALDGAELSVADLVKHRPRDNAFNPNRSGSFSLVQATFSVSLLLVEGDEHSIPAFKGEVEARIQTDVLRLAGRFRSGFRYKDDRVKLPLDGIVHARVRSTSSTSGCEATHATRSSASRWSSSRPKRQASSWSGCRTQRHGRATTASPALCAT